MPRFLQHEHLKHRIVFTGEVAAGSARYVPAQRLTEMEAAVAEVRAFKGVPAAQLAE
jgi:hypothetical protein